LNSSNSKKRDGKDFVNDEASKIFCIIYDSIVIQPSIRNNAILTICCACGFIDPSFFAFMLLDVLNISKTLSFIIRSISDNTSSLCWVFYLFTCTVAIYAQFGLRYFEEFFAYGDDDSLRAGCHSTLSCFILIFYHGLPSSSLDGAVLNPADNTNPHYIQRVIFDLTFFIWVGLILFNIITGLLVDGFGSLRESDAARIDLQKNECFVCGFTRTDYEDSPNLPDNDKGFEYHKDNEHDYWQYAYFCIYLNRKSKDDLTGVESYVWSMIQKKNTEWTPTRNSLAIQIKTESKVADEADSAIDPEALEKIGRDVKDLKKSFSALEKVIAHGKST